jgi:hypothetical protein
VEDKNPVVIGRLGRNPDLPTVTFYGHYDVQPAMEREWATDPFEVAAIDGFLYGRGTSDNKVPPPSWPPLPLHVRLGAFPVQSLHWHSLTGCAQARAG